MDLVIGKPKIWHFASRGLGGLEVCAFPFFGVLTLSSTEGHHHTVPTQPPRTVSRALWAGMGSSGILPHTRVALWNGGTFPHWKSKAPS